MIRNQRNFVAAALAAILLSLLNIVGTFRETGDILKTSFVRVDCKAGDIFFLSSCDGLQRAFRNSTEPRFELLPLMGQENTNITLGATVWHDSVNPVFKEQVLDRVAKDVRRVVPWPMDTSNTPSVAVFRKGAFANIMTGQVQSNDVLYVNNGTTTISTVVIMFNNCGAESSTPLRNTQGTKRLKPSRRYKTAVLLSDAYSRAYFHATVEQLPRLLRLPEFVALDHTNDDVTVVVRKELMRSYCRDLLSSDHTICRNMVVINDSMDDAKKDSVIYADTLLVVEPTYCGHLQPAMAQAARHSIRKQIHNNISSTRRTILLVRRRTRRDVENHDQLEASLREALDDEEIVVVFDENNLPPPGLPQWILFSQAKLVIAPHGAGLSNVLAAAPDTHVVEFLGEHPEDWNVCFWNLAIALGLQYHPLVMHQIADTHHYEVHDIPGITAIVLQIVLAWNDKHLLSNSAQQ